MGFVVDAVSSIFGGGQGDFDNEMAKAQREQTELMRQQQAATEQRSAAEQERARLQAEQEQAAAKKEEEKSEQKRRRQQRAGLQEQDSLFDVLGETQNGQSPRRRNTTLG